MAKMMADKNSEDVSIEMLPLPEMEPFATHGSLKKWASDYARAVAEHNVKALRAERDSFQRVGIRERERADRLAEALRGLMLNSPGGHSCEEFHHYKSDRHMPGDDCPVQLRWNKAVTTAQAALRDHDQEVGNGSV